jgi:hypothetical protein
VYVHDGLINKEIDFHTNKSSTSLSEFDSIFERFFWKPMSVDMKVILLVDHNTTLYIPCRFGNSWGSHVQDGYKRINEEIDFHINKNSTSLSAFGSIFERFFWKPMSVGVRVILLVEHDMALYIPMEFENSWGFHVQDGYKLINEEIDFHINKNSTSLSAFGSILKIF